MLPYDDDANTGADYDSEGHIIRIDAARALGALGAVPPNELVLWEPREGGMKQGRMMMIGCW